jgi:transposase-like protein
MLQRIRNCFNIYINRLDNELEIDETYIGGKNKNRHKDKKIENSQGRSCKDKTPVLGMVERGGEVSATVVENTKAETITCQFIQQVKSTASINTYEFKGYVMVSKLYDHSIVKYSLGEYIDGKVHTNTIEGFWSLLKRGIVGIYHPITKKHLQKYIDEFIFRYNLKDKNENERFDCFL